VVAASEELATREEGCLSLPDNYAEITRPARVKIRYLDGAGVRREMETDCLLAALRAARDRSHWMAFCSLTPVGAQANMIMRRLAKEQAREAR